ncbi:hypothetical protein [Micromonospora sp. DT62]
MTLATPTVDAVTARRSDRQPPHRPPTGGLDAGRAHGRPHLPGGGDA